MSAYCEMVSPVETVLSANPQQIAPSRPIPISGPAYRMGRIDAALRRIAESPLQSIKLHTVAASVSLSDSHFRFLFRQQVGMPFHQYLIRLRLRRADALLRSTSYKVCDIMKIVGITDRSHFVRDYKRSYGVSPSVARRTRSRLSA